MKKLLIVVVCIVSVVGVGLLAFMGLTIAGVLPQGGFRISIAEPELANRQAFTAAQYESISVSYAMEEIDLLPSATDEVVLEEYLSNWDDDMLANIDSGGDALRITAGRRNFGFSFFSWRAKVKLYLPAGWQGALVLENSSGSIESEMDLALESLQVTCTSGSIRLQAVFAEEDILLKSSSGSLNSERLTAGGAVQLAATSGSVRPGNVQAADSITASTSSGSVRFDSAAAARVEASATSGSVRFDRLDGEFLLKTSSGSIRVEGGDAFGQANCTSGGLDITLSQLAGDIKLETSSGGCKLELPADSAFNFSAQTSSGSIKTPDNSALSYNEKGNQANGHFGSAPTHTVRMEATSGSVRLQWH